MFFISNSLPKSGSSLMFNYQRLLLQKIFSTEFGESYKILSKMLRINCLNGFIPPSNMLDLENILMNEQTLSLISPCIIKTHAPYTKKFSEYMQSSPNIYSSLCIRDPSEILYSAMINHINRPSEFKYFSNPILGSLRITLFYYRRIYRSFISPTYEYSQANIIHYENLKKNPQQALFKSMEKLLFKSLIDTDKSHRKERAQAMVNEIVSSPEIYDKVRYRITSAKDKKSYKLLPYETFVTSLILFLPTREFRKLL